jgi:hypothetical protein
MPRTITTQEATVDIMQVEIQVLKVGKKQVTMGLFRQLPHEPLLEGEDVHLRGVPWGHVNYWWDGDGSQADDGPRLHVVWQQDTVLYRSVIDRQPPRPTRRWLRSLRETVMDRLFIWLAGQASSVQVVSHSVAGELTVAWQGLTWPVLFSDDDISTAYKMLIVTTQAAQRLADGTEDDPSWRQRYRETAEPYLKLLEHRGLHDVTEAQLLAERDDIGSRVETYERRWAQQWKTLSELPQLFIAV